MERAQLIQILRCPKTMQPVREATAGELAECNLRIIRGEIFTTSGVKAARNLSSGLIREDAHLLFPTENGIPVMLIEDALVLG